MSLAWIRQPKALPLAEDLSCAVDDVVDEVAKVWAEQCQNYEHHNFDQHKDQSIFNQTLRSLTRQKQRRGYLPMGEWLQLKVA